ncbi:trypsin-like peptidase domain-containing protein [Actinoplanes sp. NBRC 101535]|uniref:VMAP-C domain-containing protein n=1 Tax=Actinoplanes sp. NBRC 101535 TaxID=3032196 RepID=UPI00249FD42B|nr:trypsin-like peptidase domain-containing protein [Actinoplanes sp. NBRC 101535]GLY04323.1 serine protease [Actinoplanes sp. NBRC 101535]
MTEPLWQARIDVPATGRRGSGFLVGPRHVLTCAHVVRGQAAATVVLRDRPEPRPAAVVTGGPWWTPTADAADVAVLELEQPVRVPPAEFAPHHAVEIYAGQPFTALGFPRGFADDGVNTRFRAAPLRLMGANVQLDADDDLGAWLPSGFSGAAAYHESTGRVVGMIKGASAGEERIGVMVPVARLAQHCPRLDDIIELGALSARAYTELRAALRPLAIPPAKVGRILARLRGQVDGLPHRLTTLPALIESLVVEPVDLDDEEMLGVLSGLLTRFPTDEIRRWVNTHIFKYNPTVPVPVHECAVVIRLEPSAAAPGETYDLTVWTVTGPDGELTEPVLHRGGLTRAQWRDQVETALVEALDRLPAGSDAAAVEFVLPRSFLAEPVDEWTDLADDRTPLGITRPVTVRDLDWFHHANPARLTRSAEMLRERHAGIGEHLRWRDCTEQPGDPVRYKAWLRQDDGPFALGLAGDWSRPEHVAGAVAAGPPILLWRRLPCQSDHPPGADCPTVRYRQELGDRLRGTTIDTIGAALRRIRADAAAEGDKHCGSGVTLLRDDGRRRPLPLSFAE